MSVDVAAIVAERLEHWSKTLVDAHATPLVLVAIGHDQAAGKLFVLVVDEPDLTNEVLAGFLRKAERELMRQR